MRSSTGLWWTDLKHLSTDYAENRRAFLIGRLAAILRADPTLTAEQCAERLGVSEDQVFHMRRKLGIRRERRDTRAAA